MARMRVFIVFVFAVSVGGVFALATYNYVQKAPGRTVSIPTTPVVVAASDLDIGAELRREDLRIIEWPANALPADAIHDPKDAGAGLPPAIPPGLRAVSVRVNEVIGVAGYVLPGTHVDVVATVSPTQNQADMATKVILTNVEVLAAGT